MTFTEKKELRVNLLKKLYQYYFDSNGSWYSIKYNENEINLAYKYLEDKGLIIYSDTYQQGSIMITTAGIDFIEENINI